MPPTKGTRPDLLGRGWSWGDVLVADEAAAVRSLAELGATFVPALTLGGRVGDRELVRRFGVVWRLPASGLVRDVVVGRLAHPANAAFAEALRAGTAGHLVGSRRVVQDLADHLPGPVHLPWALRPLNVDVAGTIEDWADDVRPSFSTFFSQNVDADAETVTLRRVFSLPVRGSGEGTLHEPLYADALDADVGLILEVDAEG